MTRDRMSMEVEMSAKMELRVSMTLGYLLFWDVSSPAATCHHYSRWYYPRPQTCASNASLRARAANAHDWYVEFVLPDERAAAIEILKKQLAIKALTQ